MALTDPAADIRSAIVAKLSADPALANLIADRIYDRVPAKPDYPLVTIGNMQVIPESADGIDAAETAVTIHVWDQFKAADKSRQVGGAVVGVLHDEELSTASSGTQSVLLESANYLRDPDGVTNHAVLTFSILTDAAAS
ncbi:DUF3168 domain-containing protein [Bradyrhizobium sp. BR 10261]|uniref:DUF3168 domain-containing protein n=1 Tax=Bradyrhizobium sp. BR 10261 TaxID=2749992 RepID=UPI001C64E01B|nr:DUF3168 domain-containing protein [Bradyrhizobium sp. BR 10261]MBW7967578.1 DUF3168 domain-containing protein [Bradyrhizobium sp. BR 10261]